MYYDHLAGSWYCRSCLEKIVREQYLRTLRAFNPRRDDQMLVVCRGDGQSKHSAKLLAEIEREYPVEIEFIEVGEATAPEEPPQGYRHQPGPGTYTSYRLELLRSGLLKPGKLVVMPDTLEDLATYALYEVWRGLVQGLMLDIKYRTAYPQSRISSRMISALGYNVSRINPEAWRLLQSLERSTPTLPYSAVKTLMTIIQKSRERYKTL